MSEVMDQPERLKGLAQLVQQRSRLRRLHAGDLHGQRRRAGDTAEVAYVL